MKPPFVRSPYNYDVEAASAAAAYVETMPSLTVQSQAEDADLNILMKRFGVTGKLPENTHLPQYGDFDQVSDFRSALEAINSANASFYELPAETRARFDNDPQRLLEFVSVPGNAAEGARLGLWKDSSVATVGSSGVVPGAPGGAGGSSVDAGSSGASPSGK